VTIEGDTEASVAVIVAWDAAVCFVVLPIVHVGC
jgi:hypothetical protein